MNRLRGDGFIGQRSYATTPRHQLKAISRGSLRHAVRPDAEKAGLLERPEAAFAGFDRRFAGGQAR